MRRMWGLLAHACAFCVHRTALCAFDKSLRRLATLWPPLPPSHMSTWTVKSGAFLIVNSLIEHCFLVALYANTHVSPMWSGWKTFLRFYALFWCDDLFYTLLHAWFHLGPTYRMIHCHHHQEKYPRRGYQDAGNENPIEQILALTMHMAAVETVRYFLGIDQCAVFAHLSVKAMGSCVNHIDRAVVIHLGMGIKLDASYHRSHHQTGTKNFAQFIPALDFLVQRQRPGKMNVPREKKK